MNRIAVFVVSSALFVKAYSEIPSDVYLSYDVLMAINPRISKYFKIDDNVYSSFNEISLKMLAMQFFAYLLYILNTAIDCLHLCIAYQCASCVGCSR